MAEDRVIGAWEALRLGFIDRVEEEL